MIINCKNKFQITVLITFYKWKWRKYKW